ELIAYSSPALNRYATGSLPGLADEREHRQISAGSSRSPRTARASDGHVAALAVLQAELAADVPGAGGGTPDRDVGLAVAVVVARHRYVAGLAPGDGLQGADVPGAGGRSPDGDVGFAVAVVVARHWDVA